MIKDTFELFREPFDRAGVNRDYALERDSTRAALTARFQYVAQIIASLVSLPFLILAGLYDLLTGKCNPCTIPLALFSQLFIILPISFFSAIFPLSWSQGIDRAISNFTRERAISNYTSECLLYLTEQAKTLRAPTIQAEDIQAAIRKKNDDLKAEALKKTLIQIKQEILAAPRGSIEQSDLYEMHKKKKDHLTIESRKTPDQLCNAFLATLGLQTLDELRAVLRNPAPGMTDTLAYHDLIDTLAHKRANGPETLAQLLAIYNGPLLEPIVTIPLTRAIILKYEATHTVQQLEALAQQQDAPEHALIVIANTQKKESVEILAICETDTTLSQPPRGNDPDLYQKAHHLKLDHLEQLKQANSFETLRSELAKTRNPVQQSDLTEAIIQKYIDSNSYYDLNHLCTYAPDDTLLTQARARRERDIDIFVAVFTAAQIEAALLATVPEQDSETAALLQHQDHKEALRRKYLITNTLAGLEAMAAPIAPEQHPLIKEAAVEVLHKIQNLATSKTLAALRVLYNEANIPQYEKARRGFALDAKQEKINHLCEGFSVEQLNEKHHESPAGKVEKSDLEVAFNQKRAYLTNIVRNNTLPELEAQLAAVPAGQEVMRQDLDFVVREKRRLDAAAARAAAGAGASGAAGAGAAIPPAPVQGETPVGPGVEAVVNAPAAAGT